MALIHDLAESQIGDLMPEEKVSESSHRADENRAMLEILNSLSDKTRNLIQSDWRELLASKSKEAKLIWQLDKLEMFLQSKDYEKGGYEKRELERFQNLEKLDGSVAALARLYPLTI
jgi:putative hydrolases of HD superfamily